MLRFRDDRHLGSNGYDVSRLASYKSELQRCSERFYVKGRRGSPLRETFIVKDLRGGVWRVRRSRNTR